MNEETKNYWMGTTFMWICGLLFVMGGLQSMGCIPDPDKQRTLDVIYGRAEWVKELDEAVKNETSRHDIYCHEQRRDWPNGR